MSYCQYFVQVTLRGSADGESYYKKFQITNTVTKVDTLDSMDMAQSMPKQLKVDEFSTLGKKAGTNTRR